MSLGIGLFGCGTIATEVARAIDVGDVDADFVAVSDRNADRMADVAGLVERAVERCSDRSDLAADADFVPEAAGQSAVPTATDLLQADTDVVLLSVGTLADEELQRAAFDAVDESADLYVPSEAIAGLDDGKTASVAGGLDTVELTTVNRRAASRAPPRSSTKGSTWLPSTGRR